LHLKSNKDQYERNHHRGGRRKDDVAPKDQWHQSEEREQNAAIADAYAHDRKTRRITGVTAGY
jgi:hypothetical protein